MFRPTVNLTIILMSLLYIGIGFKKNAAVGPEHYYNSKNLTKIYFIHRQLKGASFVGCEGMHLHPMN